MTKTRYTMRIDPSKMMDLIEAAIGRRPDEMGKSGLHTWSFTFKDPDLTIAERNAAKDALPEWMRMLYSFSREVVTDEE